jgi:hypothetical protein
MKVYRTNGSRGVIHVRAPDQHTLCQMFVRPQEFYESPYPEIRGHYFTLNQFKERYAADHGGVFTYCDDWHGFNIPGHVMHDFFRTFNHDLSASENALDFYTRGMNPFYLIGSHASDDAEDSLEHELVHATYYLNDWYMANAIKLVENFRTSMPAESGALEAYLKAEGYGDTTLTDEVNAYLATTDEAWWVKELEDPVLAVALYAAGAPFRALAADYNTKHRWLP